MPKKSKPAKFPENYKHLNTGNRGEDANETVQDIMDVAKKALFLVSDNDKDSVKEALQAIVALCDATTHDSVD